MNAKDLELKIAGLEKAIQEHKADADRYQDELKSTQKELKDYNKPELTAMMMDEVNEAIEKAIGNYDFTDTENYEIDFEIDYDNKISISSLEFNNTDELCEQIVDNVQDLFKEVDAPKDEETND